MADDDKSMSKGAAYSYKGYVVGNYKDLLESLRAEDPDYRRREDKLPDDKPSPAQTAPAAAQTSPAAESAPIEKEPTPAAAETVPAAPEAALAAAETVPAAPEAALAAAETVPAAPEAALAVAETTPPETKKLPAGPKEPPITEKDESPLATNNLVTTTPPAEETVPPPEKEPSPAESLIAANELLAAIALVLEKEKIPAAEKEPTAVAEELAVTVDEIPPETAEPPVAQDEPAAGVAAVVAATAAAPVAAAAAEESARLGRGSDSLEEDDFSQENRRRADMIYFDLTMVFLLATISAVLFYLPDMDSFSIFFWASCMIFSMTASYNLGLPKGMIIAVLTTLGYGGYVFYETMVAMTVTAINFSHIAWFVFLPLGSFLTGKLSNSIAAYFPTEDEETQDD